VAVKTDAGTTIARYFEAIDAALSGLDIYLREEDSPLYKHQMTGRILSGYILRLRHSFEAWQNRVAFADKFRINQAESGYPVFKNVLDLTNDASGAKDRLAQIPDGEILREDIDRKSVV